MKIPDVGDRVRVLPFSQIDPDGARGVLRMEWNTCFGIRKSTVDKYATEEPYYTVTKALINGYKIDANGVGGELVWHLSMLAPYEDHEEEIGEEDPERMFTSLFGAEVEVI